MGSTSLTPKEVLGSDTSTFVEEAGLTFGAGVMTASTGSLSTDQVDQVLFGADVIGPGC